MKILRSIVLALLISSGAAGEEVNINDLPERTLVLRRDGSVWVLVRQWGSKPNRYIVAFRPGERGPYHEDFGPTTKGDTIDFVKPGDPRYNEYAAKFVQQ